MAAMYWVSYTDKKRPNDPAKTLTVYAADAKSLKAADVRASYKNARKRATDRLKKQGVTPVVQSVHCVG